MILYIYKKLSIIIIMCFFISNISLIHFFIFIIIIIHIFLEEDIKDFFRRDILLFAN